MSTADDFRAFGTGAVAYVRFMTKADYHVLYKVRWIAGNRAAAHIVVDASGTPWGWGASYDAAAYYAGLAGVAVQRPH